MRCLLLVVFCLVSACHVFAPSVPELPPLPAWQASEGRGDASLGRIVELKSGAVLTPAQLVERLAVAPRVLVGEQHDNPDHHALELWLLQALAERRAQGSLLLEMINPDQQAKVDEVKTALRARQAPADLPAALAWQKGWDWALYGPLIEHALRQPYPLMAANLDYSEIKRIYKKRPPLVGLLSTAESVRKPLLDDIRESHCGLLPEKQMPAMLAVQQQRDRRMAERLLLGDEPAMLFAGAFHVRKDLGVPLHLTDLGAGTGNAVLILAEVGKPVAAESADYVWYTAALPAEDHCAELRH